MSRLQRVRFRRAAPHGRPPPAAAADGRRDTAFAQRYACGANAGASAVAKEKARGRSARHRLPIRAHSARDSHAATAPLVVRSCTRASVCRARRTRSAAVIGISVRVCCCAAPARTARADQHVSWSHARTSRMHLPAHSAGPQARCCRPKLSWRRMRRCVPSRCASV